jgi:tRNA dimethylallyltransferase
VLQVCLLPPKEYIRPIVEQRIDERLAGGMIEETRELIARGVPREWLLKIGLEYYWNVKLIDGEINLKQYRENLATKTMQFAKRQRTWFKRERNAIFLTKPERFLDDTIRVVSMWINQNRKLAGNAENTRK